MNKPRDIASFPSLFDDMEGFLAEQRRQLRQAGLWSATLAGSVTCLAIWLLVPAA